MTSQLYRLMLMYHNEDLCVAHMDCKDFKISLLNIIMKSVADKEPRKSKHCQHEKHAVILHRTMSKTKCLQKKSCCPIPLRSLAFLYHSEVLLSYTTQKSCCPIPLRTTQTTHPYTNQCATLDALPFNMPLRRWFSCCFF